MVVHSLPSHRRSLQSLCLIGLFLYALVVGSACSAVLDLQACEDDGDCADGLSCTADGLCAEPQGVACIGDDDCEGADEICSAANRCESMPPSCATDDACPTGYRCRTDGQCRTAAEECEEHEDCFEGYLCGVNNRCIDASAQCEEDSDCEALFGESASCDDGICTGETALIGGPCQRLYGEAGEEEAILFGVILQLSGVGGGFGQPMLDSIRIGARDINNLGGIDNRKIGLIACDTEASNTLAMEAAEHLVHTAGVEAIIGLNSSQVRDIGPTITSPNDVLLISPSATAQSITFLDDDLIWRTAPSDVHQATALVGLVEHLLEVYLPDQEISEPNISVVVRRQDQWADELFDELITELPGSLVNDEQRFSNYQFANVGAGEPADYTDVAAEIASQAAPPDVVIVLGSADSWQVISQIDNALPGEPLFIGADAMKNLEEAAAASPDLEGRIWGTGPRTAAELDYQPYTIFRLKFEQELNADANNFQFVANAFDALYTLAFATASALSGQNRGPSCETDADCSRGQSCGESQQCEASASITGPNLALGLQQLADGEEIRPTSSDANQAINTLIGGGSVNYAGASGPINFDANGDPEPMPIALWCFEDGQVPERGELYTPAGDFTPLTCD